MDEAIRGIVGGFGLVRAEAFLIVFACGLFLAGPFLPAGRGRTQAWAPWAALVALVLAGLLSLSTPEVARGALAESLFRHDTLTRFVQWLSLAVGVVLLLLGWRQPGEHRPEYYACYLLIVAGVNLVAAANDLVSLFLSLELISIPTYVLLYIPSRRIEAQEATTKYFLLSVFSSALLLYGLSFLYGVVGATNLEVIRDAIRGASSGPMPLVLVVALLMVTAGLGFRITAAPFHFYAPDVFEGAALPGAALLAVFPKIAGFAGLIRIVEGTLLLEPTGARSWSMAGQATLLFGVLALVTMFTGNLLALLQDNVRRLFAYSGISHAGYMLVGLAAGPAEGPAVDGTEAVLFYLVVYGVMTLGAFAVLASLEGEGRGAERIEDLAGLCRTSPVRAGLMAVFLFSLTGLPPTAGFWGKLNLLLAAWSHASPGLRGLAIVLAINAAIGAWYYLRLIGTMYLVAPKPGASAAPNPPALLATAVCGALTIAIFVLPGPLWQWVEQTSR